MSRICLIIAIAAVLAFVLPLGYFTIGDYFRVVNAQKASPTAPTATPREQVGNPEAIVVDTKLITGVNPCGVEVQSGLVSWKNIGNCPIRLVVVRFELTGAYEIDIKECEGEICIYWAANDTPGILPGQTMNDPRYAKFLKATSKGALIRKMSVDISRVRQFTTAEFNE